MGKKYIISDERKEWLSKAESICYNYGCTIRSIKSGLVSEKKACECYGIKQNDFRKFLETLRFDIVSRSLPKDEIDLHHMLSGYERLYVYIFGIKNLVELPLDCDETFEHVLKTLKPRERKVIEERWCGGRTLDQVGDKFYLTRTRIGQIEAKALRKLRQPQRAKILRYGLTKYNEFQKMREYYSKDFVSDYVTKLEQEAQDKVEYNDIKALYDLRDDINNYISKLEEKGVGDPRHEMTIKEMDLSVRTYNCLRKAGYVYVKDLNGKTYGELMKIRNLGRKSFEEILSKCSELGVNISDEIY